MIFIDDKLTVKLGESRDRIAVWVDSDEIRYAKIRDSIIREI